MEKDFSTISPSAVKLLLLKALTDIPFAKQAAAFMFGEQIVIEYAERLNNNASALTRLLHFENRYKTIDEALDKLDIRNIIEISSGFSFRGLDRCSDEIVHYIDTDLPSIIEIKNDVAANLVNRVPPNYFLTPLNVLDENSFRQIAERLPPGLVAIVNEGLLVYLNADEKRRLCGIIHSILQKRGGCWINADIYIRTSVKIGQEDQTQKFLNAHNVEENKFEDYASADEFFTGCGFRIAERIAKPTQPLSASKYLKAEHTMQMPSIGGKHIRETWVLQPN